MTGPVRPGETRDQRDDRNLVSLLQELRVATLGVHVLFGFLLSLPLTRRFARLEAWQRYLAVIILSSVSVILLVAPVGYHRLWFRRHQLGYLIRAADRMAICGMIAVSLAASCAVLLVTGYIELGCPQRAGLRLSRQAASGQARLGLRDHRGLSRPPRQGG